MNKTTPYTIYAACVCVLDCDIANNMHISDNLLMHIMLMRQTYAINSTPFQVYFQWISWNFIWNIIPFVGTCRLISYFMQGKWRKNTKSSLLYVTNDEGIWKEACILWQMMMEYEKTEMDTQQSNNQHTHTQKKIRWRNKKICINCYLGVCCLCATIATSGTNARTEKKETVEGVNMGKRALWIIE